MQSALAETLPIETSTLNTLAEADRQLPSWAEETLTPEQFFTPAGESMQTWTGERRLLFAVLQDAVDHVLRYRQVHTTRGRRLFRETLQWFWSTDRTWLYSFESICAHLNLDPDYIRMGLKRLHGSAEDLALALSSPPRKRPGSVRHLALVRKARESRDEAEGGEADKGGA